MSDDTPQWVKAKAAEVAEQLSRERDDWGTDAYHNEIEQKVQARWYWTRCLLLTAVVLLCAAGWFGEWRLLWLVAGASFLVGYRSKATLVMAEVVRIHRRILRDG